MIGFRRITAVILLFVFAVLTTKSLFIVLAESSGGDCLEFGHIHIYKQTNSARPIDAQSRLGGTNQDNQDCHDGQLISIYGLPVVPIMPVVSVFKRTYKVVFSFENHFKSPYLEPLRKPPKIS